MSSFKRPRLETPPFKLAVVGAGPVGLALATACARSLPGVALHLFDREAVDGRPRTDARTLALNLGSIQQLSAIGAWPAEAAEPITQIRISQSAPGRSTLHLQAAEVGVPELGAVLSYGDLHAALQQAWLQAAAAQPGCHTHGNTPVRACTPQPDGRVALVLDEATLPFDLVVQAEGGVFGAQAAKSVRHGYRQTAWVGGVRLDPAWPRGLAVERFTRDGPLALLPLPGGRAAVVWCTAPDEVADQLSLTRLNALLPPDLLPQGGPAVLDVEAPLRPFALGLNADPGMGQGRLLCVGNAAQTLHPVAGQGLNLGLRDAHVLVQTLRDALPHAAAPAPQGLVPLDAALDAYRRRRAPDRWSLLAATDGLARVFTWDGAAAPWLREAGLRALQHLPPLRGLLARHMMFGWR